MMMELVYPVLSARNVSGSIARLENWRVLVVSRELTVRVLTVVMLPRIVLAVSVEFTVRSLEMETVLMSA